MDSSPPSRIPLGRVFGEGGIFPVQEGALVIYANRTFTDQLGGFGAGAKQSIGRKIMGGQIAGLYEQLRARSKR